jgi:hypothetical protein
MVGRLQTENDKKRILEGLQSAAGGVDVAVFDRLISDLDKRQFVLHTAKPGEPAVFGTRWAMSYLAGPLTRDQVTTLMKGRKAAEASPSQTATASAATTPAESAPASTSAANESAAVPAAVPSGPETVPIAPSPPAEIPVAFLDPAAAWAPQVGAVAGGSVMRPAVAATVQLHYDDTAAGIDHRETFEAVVFPLAAPFDPAHLLVVDHDPRDFLPSPPDVASFELTGVKLESKTFWTGLGRDLAGHLIASRPTQVLRNAPLKLYSRVDESEEAFQLRCREAAEDAADAAVAKLRERFEARIDRVKDQIVTAEAKLEEAQADASSRQQDELLSGAGDLLGALLGGRSRANPLNGVASRRSQTQKAKTRAETEGRRLATKQEDLVELEDELADEISTITTGQATLADQVEKVQIGLEKDDVGVAELRLVWVPVG